MSKIILIFTLTIALTIQAMQQECHQFRQLPLIFDKKATYELIQSGQARPETIEFLLIHEDSKKILRGFFNELEKARIESRYLFFNLLKSYELNSYILPKDAICLLMSSAYHGDKYIAEFLLSLKFVDVNSDFVGTGTTALMVAACEGKVKMVKLLINFGANINAVNCHNETALNLAIKNGRKDVIKLLMAA